MRLLILTQKMAKNDPILGFFVRWVQEFAKHYEGVTVICLEEGEHNLPDNVKVLSLGKEKGKSKLKYIWNFYKYIWQERKNYDSVFVHMNQEYVLLGGLLWRFLGKKIGFWRNHPEGNVLTWIAGKISHKVFCTTPHSYIAKFEDVLIMPVGIDTDFFKPDLSVKKIPNSILFLGRIAPVKNVDLFINGLKILNDRKIEFLTTIAGDSLPRDAEYERGIRSMVKKYGLSDRVRFVGAVDKREALRLYQENTVYVNLTPTGSFDKTIFEAMATETTPVVLNKGLKGVLGDNLIIEDTKAENVAGKIQLSLTSGRVENFRDEVIQNHSLEKLVKKFANK